jgi:hydrogenase expression/formation protein HypE
MSSQGEILLSHGAGGRLMHELINTLFKEKFKNSILEELLDSARLSLNHNEICFTTDSYVVAPLFFPGGDIGKLAVCGTLNDLAVSGARPFYLSCSFIIEEGLEYKFLDKIVTSMAEVAEAEKVKIVTGDIKVVEKGNADKLFINTTGIGVKWSSFSLSPKNITPEDKIILSGAIGEHELAVLVARGEFEFEANLKSDCASLIKLIEKIVSYGEGIKLMRDPTRGGLGTTLTEITEAANLSIRVFEKDIPIKKEVKSLCELLGYDPLYLANEGKVVIVASPEVADKVVAEMKKVPLGQETRVIGEVQKSPPSQVFLETKSGGRRILDMPTGFQLPRIC